MMSEFERGEILGLKSSERSIHFIGVESGGSRIFSKKPDDYGDIKGKGARRVVSERGEPTSSKRGLKLDV